MNNNQSPLPRDDTAQVHAFLAAMEARDLVEARRYLGAEFVLQLPGAPAFDRLGDMVAWAGTRYRAVAKTFHGVDHVKNARQGVVVCHGLLDVAWRDGTRSSGVRFIDRFELRDGLILRQDVWNDLALVHRPPATG